MKSTHALRLLLNLSQAASASAIREHRSLYYAGRAVISDGDFDKLVARHQKEWPSDPVLKEVGAKPIKRNKTLKTVKHLFPMTSLTTLVGEDDFSSWYDGITFNVKSYIVEPKMDGASLELVYRDGLLCSASLRGDGQEGEDVWHSVVRCPDVKKKLDIADKGDGRIQVVRGEMMMHRKDLDTAKYANCRNAIGGILRRSDGEGAEILKFYAFDYKRADAHGSSIDNDFDAMRYLKRLGFRVVDFYRVDQLDEIVTIWKQYEEKRDDPDFAYDMDGVVVKIGEFDMREEMQEAAGRTDADDPAWAVAFKWVEKRHVTKLKDVEMSVGRTGIITPVGIIKETVIGGTRVNRASLCNFDEVKRLGIRIGSKVEAVRSGEVIPKIVGLVEAGDGPAIRRPKECPVCGSQTQEDGPRQRCISPTCPAIIEGRLLNWSAERDILGLGPEIVAGLMKRDIDSIAKLYTMTKRDLVKAANSEVIAEKVWPEIQRTRKCTLSEFVGSVGIDGIGQREVEKLVDQGYDTLDKLLSLRVKDLLKLKGYKETKAQKFYDAMVNYADVLRGIAEHLEIEAPVAVVSDKLAGQSFCFTGVRPSKEEEDKVKSLGGSIKSGVSKNLTTLVCKITSSEKARKARELGVSTVTYEAFQDLIK